MGTKAEDSIKNCRMGEGRLMYSKTNKIIKNEQWSNGRCIHWHLTSASQVLD